MIYNFPSAIYFGWDEAKNTGKRLRDVAKGKVLLVTDKGVERVGLLESIIGSLENEGISFAVMMGFSPTRRMITLLRDSSFIGRKIVA